MHRSPKSSMPRFPSISVPSTGWRAVVVLVIAVAWLGASESASDPNSPLASQILIPHEDSRARPTRRSLAKNCVVPLQCTPALYFSTVRVGPTESKHYDKFPFGKGDSSVCQIDGPSVIALGNLSANCYRVVDNVKLDFAGPGGFRKTRVVTKIRRTPFTVFGKTADVRDDCRRGVGWQVTPQRELHAEDVSSGGGRVRSFEQILSLPRRKRKVPPELAPADAQSDSDSTVCQCRGTVRSAQRNPCSSEERDFPAVQGLPMGASESRAPAGGRQSLHLRDDAPVCNLYSHLGH